MGSIKEEKEEKAIQISKIIDVVDEVAIEEET